MNSPLISATGLSQRYSGVIAVDDLSFQLARGEVLGVIGPNGAGKSTLIGLLSGALRPSAGTIVFDSRDVTPLPASERARCGIGRTYQIPRPFLHMSVLENLLAARLSRHPFAPAAEARAACEQILERCGLADAAAQLGSQLPLLRRKRLEVARALAIEPKLMLLDEVGAGLVDAEISELVELIRALAADLEGIIIVEHVLRVVRECCSRLLVLNFGKLLAAGPTAEVLASDQVAAVYLGAERAEPAQLSAAEAPRQLDPKVLLDLRDVHAQYGQARVLHGISLQVRAGEAVAILGTNGAGKTSLARVVAGLLRVSAGAVLMDGVDVTAWPAHQIARLGIAQCLEGRRIFPTLSVEENLLLPARQVGRPELLQRLERVYTLFPELKPLRRQGGTALSGGQQQMLAIGRALMSQPRLIVFDEISLGLAPVVMDRLYVALAELRKTGITLLIIEQDVARALELADSAHVIEHGKLAISGSARECRRDPRLRKLYIGAR